MKILKEFAKIHVMLIVFSVGNVLATSYYANVDLMTSLSMHLMPTETLILKGCQESLAESGKCVAEIELEFIEESE